MTLPGAGSRPEGPVRPYVITSGRSRPSRNTLTLETLVIGTGGELPPRLPPEQLRILELCRRTLSLAEVAAHLGLPVSVVKVLLADLLDGGLILARPPVPVAQAPDRGLLREVLEGLRGLR